MPIPNLGPDGLLPLGRYICDIDEVEAAFVDAPQFATSQRRGEVFEDFLAVVNYLEVKYSQELIERAWVGGSFTTSKLEPDDIDVLFILNERAHDALSGRKRDQLGKLLRFGGVANKLKLKVDGFMVVRHRVVQPFSGGGVAEVGQGYFAGRGAWDDWWSRDRGGLSKGNALVIENCEPVRGYLEVMI